MQFREATTFPALNLGVFFFITARLSMVARMPPRLHEDELLVARDGEQGVGHHDGDVPRVLPLVPEAGGASY